MTCLKAIITSYPLEVLFGDQTSITDCPYILGQSNSLTFSWFEVFLSRVTDFYLTWKTELHFTGFPDFGWVGTLPILVTLKKPTFQSWSIRKITKRTIHYFSSTTSIHMEESICYILKWFFLASCPILSPSFKS